LHAESGFGSAAGGAGGGVGTLAGTVGNPEGRSARLSSSDSGEAAGQTRAGASLVLGMGIVDGRWVGRGSRGGASARFAATLEAHGGGVHAVSRRRRHAELLARRTVGGVRLERARSGQPRHI